MKVCVYGIWHLGSVTAAGVAEHFDTVAFDPDPATREALRRAVPPVSEPGLAELLASGLASGRLTVPDRLEDAVAGADVVWVTFDTPVDDNDEADPGFVEARIRELFPHLGDGAVVLISSQVPIGFSAGCSRAFRLAHPGRDVGFCCSPENLRLGNALAVFRTPERIVAGVRDDRDREALAPLFAPFSGNVLWMSPESAEMTKHAINSFLAVSVAFINEIAVLCESEGADARDVSRGLRSDLRIGPKAYLGAGAAFAGGTLARDLVFLRKVAAGAGLPARLISGAETSNVEHRRWPRRSLEAALGDLRGRRVAILGLTYKPGTDTLRRSESLALAEWLAMQGASVSAFDPAVTTLPDPSVPITLAPSALEALTGADAVVIATEWPEFRALTAADLVARTKSPCVVDANRFLEAALGVDERIRYIAVGRPRRSR